MPLPRDQLALLKARHDIAEVARKLGDYLREPDHPTPKARAALVVAEELERIGQELLAGVSDLD